MKKAIVLLSIFTLMSAASCLTGRQVFAEVMKIGPDAEREARREQMKSIKQQMRQKESTAPKGPKTPSKWDNFVAKEGERSGFAHSGDGAGKFFKNLNPAPFFKNQQERYNERKAAVGNKAA